MSSFGPSGVGSLLLRFPATESQDVKVDRSIVPKLSGSNNGATDRGGCSGICFSLAVAASSTAGSSLEFLPDLEDALVSEGAWLVVGRLPDLRDRL